jgi:hypothetical protein
MLTRRVRCTTLCLTVVILCGLASTALAGSAREARAIPLLPFRTCDSVVRAAVFTDELEEISPPQSSHAAGVSEEVSVCKYAGLGASAITGGAKQFTNGEIGFECIANGAKLGMANETVPPGGCFRVDSSSILVARGPAVEKLIRKHPAYRSRYWPAGYTRVSIRRVGNDAEFGYNGAGQGYGYLQVLNATLTVETEGGTSLIQVLRGAAARL